MRRTSIDAGRKAQCVRTPPDLDEGPAEEPDAGVDGGQPSFVRAKPISLRPALVVLACAVVITVGGFAVALVGTGQSQPAVVKGLGTPVPGVSLSAVGATSVLQAITSGGTPPSDVLGRASSCRAGRESSAPRARTPPWTSTTAACAFRSPQLEPARKLLPDRAQAGPLVDARDLQDLEAAPPRCSPSGPGPTATNGRSAPRSLRPTRRCRRRWRATA